jgi:hypothetical protein
MIFVGRGERVKERWGRVLDGLGVVASVGSFRPGSLWYLMCVPLLSAAAQSHPFPFVQARELNTKLM